MGRRRIDEIRDSGGSMQIGTPEEGDIKAMVSMKDALILIKERATYSLVMADQIDPGRTNPAIRDAQQLVATIGTDDPIIGKTILTADELMKPSQMRAPIDREMGLRLSLDLLRDLAALGAYTRDFARAKAAAMASPRIGSDTLPSIHDVKQRMDAFAQKAGHVVKAMRSLCDVLFPVRLKKKWVDSLMHEVTRDTPENPFARFLNTAGPVLLFVIDMRNMIEHPQPDARIEVRDFKMEPSGSIKPPVAAITMAGSSEEIAVSDLMDRVARDLADIAEAMIVNLCAWNLKEGTGPFPSWIAEVPPQLRRNPHQRFGFVTELNGQVLPMGVGN